MLMDSLNLLVFWVLPLALLSPLGWLFGREAARRRPLVWNRRRFLAVSAVTLVFVVFGVFDVVQHGAVHQMNVGPVLAVVTWACVRFKLPAALRRRLPVRWNRQPAPTQPRSATTDSGNADHAGGGSSSDLDSTSE